MIGTKPYKIEMLFMSYFLRYFIVSIIIFIFIFFTYSFIQIINETDIVKGISGYYLAKTLLYLVPSIIATSLPFSIIFASFFSVGELSSRGEITAIRVGGYSYSEISKTFIIFILVLTIFSHILIHNIAPRSNLKSKEYLRTMINRVTNINLKPKSFDTISSFSIYSDDIDENEMKKVLLLEYVEGRYNSDSFVKIEAEKGIYKIVKEKGIKITLFDGRISHIDKKRYHILNSGTFKEYETFIPFEIKEKNYYTPPKYIQTSNLKQLLGWEKREKEIYKIKKEIAQRKAAVISIALFGALSLILAFYLEKDSKYFAFLSSIGIILFYYGTNIISNIITVKKTQITDKAFFLAPFIMAMSSSYIYAFKLRKK